MISQKQLTVSWASTSSFTYDGKEHSRALTSSTLTGVNSETVNLTTSGTGVNASNSEYTTTASISSVTGGRANKNNYSLSNSSAKFKINKATPTISMNNISSPIVGTTQTYNYYYNGNGTVSCSSYSTDIATCSVNTTNKTVTLQYKRTGWNKIILSATSTTNYNSASTSEISFTVLGVTRTATIKANGNSLSTPSGCSASGNDRTCSCTSSGTSTSCSITLPTISNKVTTEICGYTTGNSDTTSCSYDSGASLTLSSNPKLYAHTHLTHTASFSYSDSPGISTSTSSYLSCTRYNGAASCDITAPTLTATTGNSVAGWYNSSGNFAASSGGSITLTSNQTFTARANITAAGVTYTDTYSMGCSTLQCAIDKVYSMLNQ